MFTLSFDIERLIHSVKTAIACIIGILLSKLLGYPSDQWAIITIIVIMCTQLYVGSVLQKAYLRLLGTLVGCLFAAITLLTFGHSNLVIVCAVSLSSFFFSYLATGKENLSYAGTLGAATTAIIMLGQQPSALLATQRFLEISMGIFIAAAVSQFILPIHARAHLKMTQANTLELLKNYYSAVMLRSHEADDLDETIAKTLLKQRQLAKESMREPLGSSFDPKHFMASLSCEREILRCITFMHQALLNLRQEEPKLSQLFSLPAFNDAIIQAFSVLIKVMTEENPLEEHIHIPTIEPVKENLHKQIEHPSPEELIYINGFLFSAETMIKSLTKLAVLHHVPAYSAASFKLISSSDRDKNNE